MTVNNNDITREKLVLLYILREAPGLERSDLIEIALGTLTADYFTLAEALNWLENSDLIMFLDKDVVPEGEEAIQSEAECFLTDAGEKILATLEDQIAQSSRQWVKEHLDATSVERKKDESIEADFNATDKGSYEVNVQHRSNKGDSFSVSLELPTEELARKASYAFKRNPEKFYQTMLKILLEEE